MKPNTIGYLIKPLERTLQRVYLSDYKDIYKAGGYDCFDHCTFNQHGDGVYVDDEGLLKDMDRQNFFFIQGTAHPLCGNGVVLGVDEEGESIEPVVSFEDFAKLVTCAELMGNNALTMEPAFYHTPVTVIEEILTLDDHAPRGWQSVDTSVPPEATEF